MARVRSTWDGVRPVVLSVVLTVVILAITVSLLGASPVDAGAALVQGAVGSPFNIGQTLVIGAVLILTALATAIPFSARLFNVGGEGQLVAGATGGAVVAIATGPGAWTLPLSLMAAVAAGAAWALVPGLIRALLGGSEMIVSLLMNFVAILMAGYVVSRVFPDSSGQATELVPADARVPVIWPEGGVHLGVPVSIAIAVAAWVVMTRTRLGFAIRAVGLNDKAARLAGFAENRTTIISFLIAGSLAGLAGGLLVLGTTGQLTEGIAASYGFIGVVVALLAGLRPAWIPLVAFLTAALMVGSNRLQIDAGLPFSMGIVVLAVLVLTLLATGAIKSRRA